MTGELTAERRQPAGRTNSCVVVLGPGRSGTSVTMKLLRGLGMRLSGALVPASAENPEGHFEDVRIVRAQQRLMASVGFHPLLPRPRRWTDDSVYPRTKRELKDVVREEVSSGPRPWGFKDPRTCVFWPLWHEVLSETGVTPRVVFCFRQSPSVVSSLMHAYGLSQKASEGIVLYRCYHALSDVRDSMLVVSYDRWWTEPTRQLEELAVHCALLDSAPDLQALVSSHVRSDLNRRDKSALRVAPELVALDRILAASHGTDYDADAIASWCEDISRKRDHLRFALVGIRRLLGSVRSVAADRLARARKSMRTRLQG